MCTYVRTYSQCMHELHLEGKLERICLYVYMRNDETLLDQQITSVYEMYTNVM